MRRSTIILTLLTVVFGAATIVLAVLVGPGDVGGFVAVIRLGGLVTGGFGAACIISVINRRRRDRLRSEGEAHPGTVFVNAHAADSTASEFTAWSPGLTVQFPCDLGFDRNGLTSWSNRDRNTGKPIASREEISGFDVFAQRTPLGSTSRWGIVLHLTPRGADPGTVHLWVIDGQPNQDEYEMRQTIAKVQTALGR